MSGTKFKIKIKIKGLKPPDETKRDPFVGKYFTYPGEGSKPSVVWKILKKDSLTGYYARSKTENLDTIETQYFYKPHQINVWDQVTDLARINNFRNLQSLEPEKYIT